MPPISWNCHARAVNYWDSAWDDEPACTLFFRVDEKNQEKIQSIFKRVDNVRISDPHAGVQMTGMTIDYYRVRR